MNISAKAAVFGLVISLISFSVLAQEAPTGVTNTGGSETIRVNSDEAIPVGPFIFSPAIELNWQDRDNIFFTPDNPVRDQVFLARARILFELPIYDSYVRISYTPQYREYKDYELKDKWSHFADLSGGFEFSNGLVLNASYKYFYGNLEVREVDPGGELIWGDRVFQKNSVEMDGSYWITQRDGLKFDLGWSGVDHQDPDLWYDYDRFEGGIGWLHQLSPILVMDVRLGGIDFDAKNGESYSPYFRDSKSTDLTIGWRGQFSPVVGAEIRFGYRQTDFDGLPTDPNPPDFASPIAFGFISWDLAHGSILRLDVLRSDYPSNYGPNAYYVATGGSLMYTIERNAFFGQARYRLQRNDYELPDPRNGIVRADDISTVGLGLGVRFTELLSLYGGYLYEDRDSTIYEASYKTNIFSLGLVFGY